MHFARHFLIYASGSFAFVLVIGLLCIAFRRVQALTRTPMLDVVLSLLTWVPWAACGRAGSWAGLLGCVLGQMIALYLWCFIHELMHKNTPGGRTIANFIDRHVGRWRNHLALWATLVVLPVFWLIRLATATIFWPLIWLLGFPLYRQSEWINVSRQKFGGLVGHDLVWCLYCDWMTGVYSLGAEMLRNVESFWCPIRYYDGKKCENCKIDFPDIANGWVPADGNMADVEKVMQEKYGDGHREWFGHPARLTVKGEPVVDKFE